jgi:cation-transporting P-type ATPase E
MRLEGRTNRQNGLSADEVAERVARGEVNRVPRSDRADFADIAARNLLTLFNALVVPAAIALFILGDYRGAVAVSGMAITNAGLGLIQEVRAKRHLDRLALMAESRVQVVRAGIVCEIPSGEVVRGDLVVLTAGDSVVADGELVEARYLEVDEALLTGESDPVPRRAGERVQSGSFAVAGEGRYIADGVGAESYVQRTAIEARRYHFAASPLQQSIDRLIRILTVTAVTLCLLYVLLWSTRRFPVTDLVQMIAATVTSMVPQGLVLMSTLAFVLGAVRLAARGAIVQRLSAVETMAEIDTLCMDKTGTLTTNNLRLDGVHAVAGDVDVDEIRRRLCLFASASLDRGNRNIAALRAALGEVPVELIDHLPFKSQNRYSAVRLRSDRSEHALVLGAPEALQQHVHSSHAARIETFRLELIKTGHRLLLFAETDDSRPFGGEIQGIVIRPLAFVAFSDELRADAGDVLRNLNEQSIEFKILSGDNAETVRATVRPLAADNGLPGMADAPVVTGAELESAAEPAQLIAAHSVFGRVTPWQKVQIVTALKESGRRVAMIGDGVNDVLPIKNAHLGIAMGEGSRAAKTVAGLVLTTNRFDLLPATLQEGRTILRNLRRAGKLFLVKNVYVLILIVGSLGLFNLPFPFLPQQVTLLNFLTIGVPVLIIMLGRQPAAATRSDFLRDVGWFTLRTGILIGGATLALYRQAGQIYGHDMTTQRTILLAALVLLGLGTLIRALRDGETGWLGSDWIFYAWSATAVGIFLVTLYTRHAAYFFDLVSLSIEQWALIGAFVVPGHVLGLLSDLLDRPTSFRARMPGQKS